MEINRYTHGGDVHGHEGIFLDFSVNLNPLGMPFEVKEALQAHIDDFAAYPDSQCRALRAALAEWEQLPAAHIVCGNGAADLIFRLCWTLRPKKALVLAPTFSEYEKAVFSCGGNIVYHQLQAAQQFTVDERFLSALDPDLDLVFLCNPNNPTGRLMDDCLLEKVVERCRQLNIILVIDECFLSFTNGHSGKQFFCHYDGIIILKAFTKLFSMAGLRLGYMLAASRRIAEAIAGSGQSWSVSAPAQYAGLAAAALTGYPEKTRMFVQQERLFLRQRLEVFPVTVYESEANYLLLQSELPLYEQLLSRGVLLRSCANYVGLNESYVRLGLKQRAEHLQLVQAIGEICNGESNYDSRNHV